MPFESNVESAPPLSVLIVETDPVQGDELAAALTAEGLETQLATTLTAAVGALRLRRVDAVVSDAWLDGLDGAAELARAVQHLQPGTPRFLLGVAPTTAAVVAAIRGGASDYLEKPVCARDLARRLRLAGNAPAPRAGEMTFAELVDILSNMVAATIERIDPYTAGHGERTRRYCDRVAASLGVDLRTRERLQLAAIAHDYGKIYLEDLGFLTKKGPLTDAEYAQVKRHPVLGARMLGFHPQLREVCAWVAEHHEKWDGSGYPQGKRWEEISVPGRILGIVEVFDSLATRRSYKEAWGLQRVLDFFERQRERAFDPLVLDPFLGLLETHGVEWLQRPEADRRARQPGAVRA